MLTVDVGQASRPGWLSLTFRYDQGLIKVIKGLPQRQWNPDTKSWHFVPSRIAVQALLGVPARWKVAKEVEAIWKQHGGPLNNAPGPEHQDTRQVLDAGTPSLAKKKPLPLQFRMFTLPFAKQMEALEYANANPKFYLNMEVGTGKTKVFFDRARLASQELGRPVRVLIIGPKNKIPDYAKRELPKHAGERGKHWEFFDGRGEQRKWEKALRDMTGTHLPEKVGMLVVGLNWESLARRTAKLPAGSFDVFIPDELHRAKNPASGQGMAAKKVAFGCRYVIGGSGTPCPNGPLDLYNQISMLDTTLLPTSFTAFRRRYAVQELVEMNGNKFMQILGYQNLTELRDIFARVSFRARQHECFDLPPVIPERRYVTLDPATAALYEQVRRDGLALLGKDIDGKNQLMLASSAGVVLLRARQLCGGFIGLTDDQGRSNGKEVPTPANNKLRYVVDELVPELMLALEQRQIVVWAFFRSELKALVAELSGKEVELPDGTKRKLRVAQLWGDTPQAEKETLTERWHAKEFDLLVANPQSGGEAQEFQSADVEIWYSRDYNLKMREQGEGRLMRYGQKRSVLRIDVLYEGTIEDVVLEALEGKRDLQKLLTNDPRRSLKELFEENF